MNLTLASFQNKAIAQLLEAMESPRRDIVLKSCTGSGKTIILTHFMDEYNRGHSNHVFVWLTPGKGDLEEQSKQKMDIYIHNAQTKLLPDVMLTGFESGDVCFINWEKLTKKGNNALKDGERTNFYEHIQRALDANLRFTIIVDESHQNNTVKAADILNMFHTEKIIRSSATPQGVANALIIDILDEDVIAEGLIKKALVINENFPKHVQVESQTEFLLERALAKQRELAAAFVRQETKVNPLIIVQLPNNSGVLQDEVERWFDSQGAATYDNGMLAVWLANQKENLDDIEQPDAKPIAVIIKQAIATGWDCPRAHILVKLRNNMDETFEVQTIGRIRRMPEAKHYGSPLLDNCYLYTLDDKFTQGVRLYLGKDALDAQTLFLKNEFQSIVLTSEQKTILAPKPDPRSALIAIYGYYRNKYNIDGRTIENKNKFEAHGYVFNSDIIRYTRSGEIPNMTQAALESLSRIDYSETLNTHRHGREFHHHVAAIALKIGLTYAELNAIVRKLFCIQTKNDDYRILSLSVRELYSFVINNAERLKENILEVMAQNTHQPIEDAPVYQVPFRFPPTLLFTYNAAARNQDVFDKNVYANYLSSAEPRSDPERKFERFCQSCPAVKWFYKNGDKGAEFFSIAYSDSLGHQKTFYPDYIIATARGIWIIETKGGFSRAGVSEDIDPFSPIKFNALKHYVDKKSLRGGFVREDKESLELCICTEEYSDDIHSSAWRSLSEVLKEDA